MKKNENVGPDRSKLNEYIDGKLDTQSALFVYIVEKHGTGLFQIARECDYGSGK